MVQRVTTTLSDDLDGSEASHTLRFAVGTTHYEIDLSEKNTEEFNRAIHPFVANGRRVTGMTAAARAAKSVPAPDVTAIREWAAQNGHHVASQGRLSAAVIKAYEAAKAEPQPVPKEPRGTVASIAAGIADGASLKTMADSITPERPTRKAPASKEKA